MQAEKGVPGFCPWINQGESEGLMGVRVRQKIQGKGNPWWVFIFHIGKRTSRKVGDKKAAEAVTSTIRAKLQLGHHSIKITIDTYYHWIPGSNKSEVDQLDSKTAPICTLSAPSHENSTKKGVANLANPL